MTPAHGPQTSPAPHRSCTFSHLTTPLLPPPKDGSVLFVRVAHCQVPGTWHFLVPNVASINIREREEWRFSLASKQTSSLQSASRGGERHTEMWARSSPSFFTSLPPAFLFSQSEIPDALSLTGAHASDPHRFSLPSNSHSLGGGHFPEEEGRK